MRIESPGVTGLRICRGFTLVEILVALLIMSVLSVLAYNAFDGILLVESRSKEEFLAENRRGLAVSIILNDLLHLRARPARDELGGVQNAYLAPSAEYQVLFTRGGLPDFPTMRGGIQRVAYRVEDSRLIRTTWPRVDVGPTPEPLDQVLATGVTRLKVEQLDRQGEFIPVWPPINEHREAEALPSMIRITLRLDDNEEMVLLVPGPDSYGTAFERGNRP